MISVVLPAYNEGNSLKEVVGGLNSFLNNEKINHQIVIVDDGSSDKTPIIGKELAKSNNIKYYRQKHSGKSAALGLGIEKSKGDTVFIFDADGQLDPKEILLFLEKINKGYDVVCGYRKNRANVDPFLKRAPSKIFNFLGKTIFNLKIRDINCGFKAFKKDIFHKDDFKKGMHRYMAAIANEKGYSMTEIPVTWKKRKYGKSKYNFLRFFTGSLEMLSLKLDFIFSKRPVRMFNLFGVVLIAISMIIGSNFLVLKTFGESVKTYLTPLFVMIMCMIIGVFTLFFGVILNKINKLESKLESNSEGNK